MVVEEFKHDPSFVAWGPFVPAGYRNESITQGDIIIASIVWGLTCLSAIQALYLAYGQTTASRSPLRSVYVWLIWIELAVCSIMGLECYLHLLKFIKPSFAFYFTILFWWCIQVQLLLQIIINRIRVIIPDRRRSKHIMIGTAVVVTAINISVFNIWIPARLQISVRYMHINEIWDRMEKVIYLIIDAMLNWYFLKTVKANLVKNGLEKYNKLLRFNQRIIVLSLLMDVMIIAAMSIPNSFVYIQFHPLAYLVKLNIEMVMANLIKRIAMSSSRRTGNASLIDEFASTANKSSTNGTNGHNKKNSYIELSAKVVSSKQKKESLNGTRTSISIVAGEPRDRTITFEPTGTQIKKTKEIIIKSEPNPDFEGDLEEGAGKTQGLVVVEREVKKSRSSDNASEGAESVKSGERRAREDSDDEAGLVTWGAGAYGWGKRRE